MNIKKIFSLISFITCSFSMLSCMKFTEISEFKNNKDLIDKTINSFVSDCREKNTSLGCLRTGIGNIDDIVKDENGEDRKPKDRKVNVTVYECDADICQNVYVFVLCYKREMGYPYEKIYFEYPKEKENLLNVALDVTKDGTSNQFFYNVCHKLYPAQQSDKKNKLRIAYIEIEPFFENGNLRTFVKSCISKNDAGIKPFITCRLLDKIMDCVGFLGSSKDKYNQMHNWKKVVFSGGDYADSIACWSSSVSGSMIDDAVLISPYYRGEESLFGKKEMDSKDRAALFSRQIGRIYEFESPKVKSDQSLEKITKHEILRKNVSFGRIDSILFTIDTELSTLPATILNYVGKA